MTYIVSFVLVKFKGSQALRLVLAGTACLFVGAALFSVSQGIAFTTALYWAITTATTVGYGDITPKNPAGRAIAPGLVLGAVHGGRVLLGVAQDVVLSEGDQLIVLEAGRS